VSSQEILFYSDFPFGYHNPEAEEKMSRFAARGYRVHYVEQLGIRNPRPTQLLRLAQRLARGRAGGDAGRRAGLDVVSPKLLAPRHVAPLDALNRAWLSRQLRSRLRSPADTILWVRYPTPELMPLVESRESALVVYEIVDDHEHGPGMTPRLQRLFRSCEDRLLERAGVVFAWSPPLRDRLAGRHPNVVLAPAAVDPEPFAAAAASAEARPQTAVYAGALDFRSDAELLAQTAQLLPSWSFELAGPVAHGAGQALAGLANVSMLGVLAQSEVPSLIASAAVCLMPYRVNEYTNNLFPVKLVEYLAAGRPVVSTPLRAAAELLPEQALAGTAAEFAAAMDRAAQDDSHEHRDARRHLAAGYSWDERIDQMERAIEEALPRA
jgi:UDP-galactopyranose mutase